MDWIYIKDQKPDPGVEVVKTDGVSTYKGIYEEGDPFTIGWIAIPPLPKEYAGWFSTRSSRPKDRETVIVKTGEGETLSYYNGTFMIPHGDKIDPQPIYWKRVDKE